MEHSSFRHRIGIGGLVFLPFLLLFLALFGDAVFHQRVFAFRDVFHFYYPLYERLSQAMLSGRLPLWDPLENLGQPLLANPVSAFFYPGKIIFFLQLIPGISYAFCFKWYILVHFPLAFGAFYTLARRFGSRWGAVFGGIAYTFSGPVLFQYTNPIFLISAAWFPLILLAVIRWVESGRTCFILLWIFCQAMTILGGDPEPVYMSFLAAGLYLPIAAWGGYFRPVSDGNGIKPNEHFWRRRIAGIAAAFAGTALLAAVQVLPAWELTRCSSRNTGAVSVWELPSAIRERISDSVSAESGREGESSAIDSVSSDSAETNSIFSGILCRGMNCPESRERGIYRFSLQPWRLPEMIWANCTGEIFPQNSRWITALPNGANEWTGSLYLGLFPLMFAVSAAAFRFRRNGLGLPAQKSPSLMPQRRIFFTFFALILVLGSLGAFGPVWFFRAGMRLFSGNGNLAFQSGDPVGGIYWWMTQIFPGFASFRYPAKLMTAAVLPLSLSAVCGFDLFLLRGEADSRIFRIFRYGGLAVSVFLIFAFAGRWGIDWPQRLLSRKNCCGFYGPLQFDQLKQILLFSGIRALVFFVILEWMIRSRRMRNFSRTLAVSILILLGADLYSAQRRHISTISEQVMTCPIPTAEYFMPNPAEKTGPLAQEGEPQGGESTDDESMLPVRFYRSWRLIPRSFWTQPSSNRPAELAYWQRATAMVHLADEWNAGNLTASGTFCPADYAQLKQTFKELADDGYLEELLAFLSCRCLLWPQSGPGPDPASCYCAAAGENAPFPAGGTLWQLKNPGPRVRICHQDIDSAAAGQKDFRQMIKRQRLSSPLEGEFIRWQEYTPERLVLDTALVKEGTLLFADQFFPGWQAEAVPLADISSASPCRIFLDIQKSAPCFRSLSLPPGQWRIVMTYRPQSLMWGGILTLLCSLIFCGLTFRQLFRR